MLIPLVLFVNTFTNVLAHEEGWNKTAGPVPSIARRLNNPICLRQRKNPKGIPYPEVNGYVDFPRCNRRNCTNPDHPAEVGWKSARAQVMINIVKRQLSFREFFAGRRRIYAGFTHKGDRPDTALYAGKVFREIKARLGALGYTIDDSVTINTPIFTLIDFEGAQPGSGTITILTGDSAHE